MKRVLCLLLLLAAPAVQADLQEGLPSTPQVDLTQGACRGPPCGIITPTMDIDLEKPMCALGKTQFSAEDRQDCAPLPAVGESQSFTGTVMWGWKLSDDGTYPNDPATDIVITFPRATGTPDWMDVKVEPESFTITTATLADPQYIEPNVDDPTSPGIWYRYEQPITVTITRTGEPTPGDLERLAEQRQPPQGILPVYVKGRSNPSGAYFTGAFAVDILQFDAHTGQDVASPATENDSPAPAVGLAVAALAFMAMRRR